MLFFLVFPFFSHSCLINFNWSRIALYCFNPKQCFRLRIWWCLFALLLHIFTAKCHMINLFIKNFKHLISSFAPLWSLRQWTLIFCNQSNTNPSDSIHVFNFLKFQRTSKKKIYSPIQGFLLLLLQPVSFFTNNCR